jgi:small conductance mechanosensitive channel
MSFWDRLHELFSLALTPILVAMLVGGGLWLINHLLLGRHPELGAERKLPRQLGMFGLSLLGVVIIAFSLPVTETTRNQVLGLVGLLVSAVFAFSSTTIVANLMAGVMLRVTMPFRAGDFIRVGEHFGRVAERGLLDTEIQCESRELVALPNTFLITHPITVVRSSGTMISTTLSLGYDVHHARVEALLVRAAEEAGLEEPFVQILELGDYSITYRISGLLTEVKKLITARSDLSRKVLDVLHDNDVEIVSPAFMNQRRLPDGARILPTPAAPAVPPPQTAAEAIVFDKAEQAEQLEKQKAQIQEELRELESTLKEASDEMKRDLTEKIRQSRERLEALETVPQQDSNPKHH